MDGTNFETRILTCQRCGAPLAVPEAGGTSECKFCGATSVFRSRAEMSPQPQPWRPTTEQEERERLRILEGQNPERPAPDGLDELVSGGMLIPEKRNEALAALGEARDAVTAQGEQGAPEAVARFRFLTEILANAAFKEQLQQRAFLEQATEVLNEQVNRVSFVAMLSRSAVRAGDLSSAERWLSQIDPYSYDLAVDSEYRLARSYLETARRAFSHVIRLLGTEVGVVPLAMGARLLCAVLRCNALERLGQVDAAATQLQSIADRDPVAKILIVKAIQANHMLQLCPESSQRLRT